jgi:hypothetical protein
MGAGRIREWLTRTATWCRMAAMWWGERGTLRLRAPERAGRG